MFWLVGLDTGECHGEHYPQGQPDSQSHACFSSDEMLFKSKTAIQPAMDPFHRRAFFVKRLPFLAAAGHRDKHPSVCCQGDSETSSLGLLRTERKSFTTARMSFDRTQILQTLPVFLKSSKGHLPPLPADRTMAVDGSLIIIHDVIRSLGIDQVGFFPISPVVANVNHRENPVTLI